MGLLDEIKEYDALANEAKETIERVYLADDRPWVLGFSGGKDSTTTLQIVIETLTEMKKKGIDLKKTVYVISSDTMVETPLIISSIANNLKMIQKFADNNDLPISTNLVKPANDSTFWVNLIGKGYPAPNQSFRWCTDRMKIEPSNRFIKERVSEYGEVIVILGVREGESTSRDRVIKKHYIKGKDIMSHTTLSNAFTFAPIKRFNVDDVWNYLLNNNSPWGADNEELFKLYSDSNANECPLIIDKETKEKNGSCGNSRFGCWVCTVVSEDKALTGFVENGVDWLKPLLQYRNWLTKHRDDRRWRMKRRANGGIYTIQISEKVNKENTVLVIPKKSGREKVEIEVNGTEIVNVTNDDSYTIVRMNELKQYLLDHNVNLDSGDIPNLLILDDEGHYNLLGLGPYTYEMRFKMLERLLKIQREVQLGGHDIELITLSEIKEIRRQWLKRGLIEDTVPRIYASVYNEDLICEKNDIELINSEQYDKLTSLCKDKQLYVNPLIEMLNLEKNINGNRIKGNLSDKIGEILTKDYLHI